MQEAHRNFSFRCACSARLQAGILGSSTCSPEGERYTLALGLHNGLYSQGKDSKRVSPAANYTPREPPSNGKLVNSLLLVKNTGEDLGQV
jgi:hypothetical protein